jgi:four helix bundle protein
MRAAHFKDLVAWQRAMQLASSIYRLTSLFPAEERFGLVNQMRRCAVSIPSNIAEGQGRGTPADFARFLRIANGSRQELETQLLLAIELGFASEEAAKPSLDLIHEVGRLTSGLQRSIQ